MLNHNETLINEAIDYRLSLDNRTEVERNLIYPIYRRLVLPEIISNFSWKDVNSSKLLKSSEYNFYLKNLKTFLYSNFKLAESYRSILDTKSKQTFNEIHEIKNKYSKLQDLFFGIKKDLAFSGTTTTSKSFFEERGLEEIYDLEDNKDTFDFFKLNLSKSKVNILESAIEEEVQVHPVNAYVFGKSINSSKIEQSDSIDYLWRDNKRFKYIVFKKAPSSDVLVRDDTAELNLIIDFGFIQSLNEMTIDGGSYLPVVLNESKLEYYDQDTAEWKLIQLSIKRNNLNNKILMFNTIKTNKVRLQFQQFKSLDNVAEAFLTRDEAFTVDMLNPGNSIPRDSKLYKVYDLSIDSIKFKYKKYKHKSIFREKHPVEIKKAKFCALDVKFIPTEHCFVEQEMELQLYPKKETSNWVSKIIGIPTGHRVKELLIKDGKHYVLNFPVAAKVGAEAEGLDIVLKNSDNLEVGEYTIAFDANNPEKFRSYTIEIESTANFFYAEYRTTNRILYDDDVVYENGSLQFKGAFLDKKILCRPRYIFRNKNKNSCYVVRYTLSKNSDTADKTDDLIYKLLRNA
jgi:hypothetical protein